MKNGTSSSDTLTIAPFSLCFLRQHIYFKQRGRCGWVGLLLMTAAALPSHEDEDVKKVTAKHDQGHIGHFSARWREANSSEEWKAMADAV